MNGHYQNLEGTLKGGHPTLTHETRPALITLQNLQIRFPGRVETQR
jgi:hypothetical protein